jgi:UDP-N-acetylmuramate--alanine ligase
MNISHDKIHIVGAGGAGMSAIAKILLELGHQVTGSDLRRGASLDALADLGVETFTGHHPDVALAADLIVASSAVPDYDEELTAARDSGIPTWRRPELLSALTEDTPTIGATGTHGKTTTTAMLITAVRAVGLDPSFIIGGTVSGLETNGHLGASDLLVIEADEAYRTFESLDLQGLVVTNVEPEHLEHFGDVDDLLVSFTEVARGVDGPVVACIDDPGAEAVAIEADAITYGLSESAAWRVIDPVRAPGGIKFTIEHAGQAVPVALNQPGIHHALNATGALALAGELGHDIDVMARAFSDFRGVSRRWEHRGTIDGVVLYDDYAHHPTEVAATLEAARGAADGLLWVVFQPHLYSRTKRFSDEFGAALAVADRVVVTDVFGSREEPVPGITGELIADAAAREGADVHYIPHRSDLADFLVPRLAGGDLVLTMGAGDITLLHAELALRLAER